ncbi:MAG: hypothetical protein LBQ59_01500 [Candidatus Peribacteria bacterium]|nr:hypothetical protein [Candidatus Peribacteria bacterium]
MWDHPRFIEEFTSSNEEMYDIINLESILNYLKIPLSLKSVVGTDGIAALKIAENENIAFVDLYIFFLSLIFE